jgi:hypothetical protein
MRVLMTFGVLWMELMLMKALLYKKERKHFLSSLPI